MHVNDSYGIFDIDIGGIATGIADIITTPAKMEAAKYTAQMQSEAAKAQAAAEAEKTKQAGLIAQAQEMFKTKRTLILAGVGGVALVLGLLIFARPRRAQSVAGYLRRKRK